MMWGHGPLPIKVSWFSRGEAVELFLLDIALQKRVMVQWASVCLVQDASNVGGVFVI